MGNRFVNEKTLNTTAKYIKLAKEIGVSPVTLAVAYSKHFDFVASTIIGARTAEQLDDSYKAFDLNLDKETMDAIKEIQSEIMYPMG